MRAVGVQKPRVKNTGSHSESDASHWGIKVIAKTRPKVRSQEMQYAGWCKQEQGT